MTELIKCGACGELVDPDSCGVLGACFGNMFCEECETEIDMNTGDVALLCGNCDTCRDLMIDGDWGALQRERERQRMR